MKALDRSLVEKAGYDNGFEMVVHYLSETFRVLKDNEAKAYGEYRTQRLTLAAWDREEG